MSVKMEISFSKSAKLSGGLAILLKTAEADSAAGAETVDPAGVIAKAARIARFSAKSMGALDIVAPEGAPVDRIVVIGLGKVAELTAHDWLKAGGAAASRIKNTDKAAVFIDVPGLETSARAAADFALGMLLRAYSFDTYKTKKGDEEEKPAKSVKVTIVTADPGGAKKFVLCDALWYCNDRFKPQFMINLATLTGAIVVALGNVHAGLFSNDDQLSAQLTAAGLSSNEKLWRMPLGRDYDKLIDSKFADMKNTGGRQAGSITAAHFLKRFVQETPWAHLDIAGTAMGSPQDEINQSWGSGFGVRLLDELVRAHYES
ncbi:hypothetical protein E0H71_15350 [Rhizobium leguminosarum bv. viciae]|uniref:M17 family peptidase N-terminal domain-containing protein n=1 Tax=Rhizobium leguminosarum TaxID=384 RepID=UPI001040A947|nr:M17 family peptidase N-terminal domain-containing protein [Rhizobium leguminosarum]TCA53614.1 hypothetical protein E0H71_15350 [Rhizobium leguminosarum bv. viciae]